MVILPDVVVDAIPVVMILLSLGAAMLIFPLPESATRLRPAVNLTAAALKVLLTLALFPVVLGGALRPEVSLPFLPGVPLVLRVDQLSVLFAALSSILWLVTTVYAIGYLRGSRHQSRFFGFFSLCVTATVGISFSGNLITFLVFFEMLTLVTYPLVAHTGTPEALRAARVYLRYALGGGLAVLLGVVWLYAYVGRVDFAEGGSAGVATLAAERPGVATLIFGLLIVGLGVKSALVPLHGWLPNAMVAPAPVSALLHAVAVVKAGVFGIVRVVDDVYGIDVAADLGVLTPLLVWACVTILYGSLRALQQQDLKARLAYSTVSQVSYVTLGLTVATVVGTTGGMVHLVHQGLMKITLFFAAGLFKETVGVSRIDQMDGLGRRMPWTSAAFTVGAAGMIGLPPTAGFVTKWFLGAGAVQSAHPWVLGVLLTSSLLNALYFLPVVYRMWFRASCAQARAEDAAAAPHSPADDDGVRAVPEPAAMLVPVLITAGFSVAVAVLAAVPYAPLDLAGRIAEGVHR